MISSVASCGFSENLLPEGHTIGEPDPDELPEGSPEPLNHRVAAAAGEALLGQETAGEAHQPTSLIPSAPPAESAHPSAPPRHLLEEEPSPAVGETAPAEPSRFEYPELVALGIFFILAAFFLPPPFSFGLFLVGAIFVAAGSMSAEPPALEKQREVSNIPLRYQWNENGGYCGECSMIASGLCYGQYFSQFDARAITAADPSDPYPKNPQTKCQLLLGQNDAYAASQMRLNAAEWSRPEGADAKAFLVWVKQMTALGYPVSIGVYTNENLFYGDTNPDAGDKQYDHIVTVTSVTSKYTDGQYHDDDVITFDDHALWNPDGNPQYRFSYTFKDFQRTRVQANDPDGPIYSLNSNADIGNFGIAVQGVMDAKRETFPVRVDTSANYENPEIADKSNQRPASMPLTLTVTVSGLAPGKTYRLYKYDDEQAVPESDFNDHSTRACHIWEITPVGSTYTLTDTIQSSDKAIYRAVLAPVN